MFKSESFKRSRMLLRHSFRILWQDKKLLLFPALSLFFGAFLFLLFMAPALLEPTGFSPGTADYWLTLSRRFTDAIPLPGHRRTAPLSGWAISRFAAFYLIAMFTSTFVNVAFYQSILRALAGEPVSLRASLAFAATRTRSILAWCLFASTIGVILQLLADRLGWIGRLMLRLAGVGWSVAAAFVIPVMVREDSANPVRLLKSSAAIIKQTWGESVMGFIGIRAGLVVVFVVLPIVMFFTAGLSGRPEEFLGYQLVALAIGFTVWISLINVADAIYRCALYVYATEGVVPGSFPLESMDAAWSVKKPR